MAHFTFHFEYIQFSKMSKTCVLLIILAPIFQIVFAGISDDCKLSPELKFEIASYQPVVDKIIDEVVAGSFKGKTYNELSYMVDKYGNRLAGSETLEKVIDFMIQKMKAEGLENVHGENATVSHWVRGAESLELLEPRPVKLAMLGLGGSVGTPPEGIQAEVIVVTTFDELRNRAEEVRGKIVVLNPVFEEYGATVEYRTAGASKASKFGAVAVLVRSITPFSVYSPHTGQQVYADGERKIPAACITVEDADMLERMQNRSRKIYVNLKMEAKSRPPATSRNVVGEIKGSKLPDDVIIVSGHIDSWDVGQGAVDDGGGVFVSLEALLVLKYLKLTPRRTLRAILWTAEETGKQGARAYLKEHEHELDKIKTFMESDDGTFRPLGFDFTGTSEAGCIVQEILKLFERINTTALNPVSQHGSDIDIFVERGVTGLSLSNDDSKYYYFHHTKGDTMTVQNSDELDLCTAFWAAAAYVLADLSVELPQKCCSKNEQLSTTAKSR